MCTAVVAATSWTRRSPPRSHLEHRGAQQPNPCSGDGVRHLDSGSGRTLREAVDFELPPQAAMPRVRVLPQSSKDATCAVAQKTPRRRGAASPGLARSPHSRTTHRWALGPVMPCPPSGGAPCRRKSGGAWRRCYVVRKRAEQPAPRVRVKTGRAGKTVSRARPARRCLQGHADHPAAQGLLPRFAGRATDQRARHRTRGSPRTLSCPTLAHPFRRGSRNNGRSTPSPVTITDAGPAGADQDQTSLGRRPMSKKLFPICTLGSRASTRCSSELLHLADAAWLKRCTKTNQDSRCA